MYLAFYKGRGRIADRAVRMFTRGPYSHVELVCEKPKSGAAFVALSASGRDGGVREKLIRYDSEKWDFVALPFVSATAYARAKSHIGARYDYRGILLSQLFHLRKHDPRKWFCSELCAMALGFARPHTFSPVGLWGAVQAQNKIGDGS